MANTSLLSRGWAMVRMHLGRLLGWLLWSRNLQPTIRVSQPPGFSRFISRLGLKSVPFVSDPIGLMPGVHSGMQWTALRAAVDAWRYILVIRGEQHVRPA